MSTPPTQKPTLAQMIFSVLAAMFGVQSGRIRERDFTHGSPTAFILLGMIAVILLVVMVYFLVKLVILYAKGN